MNGKKDTGKLPEEQKIDPKKEGGHTNQGNDRTGGHSDTDPLPNNPAKNAERTSPEEDEEND